VRRCSRSGRGSRGAAPLRPRRRRWIRRPDAPSPGSGSSRATERCSSSRRAPPPGGRSGRDSPSRTGRPRPAPGGAGRVEVDASPIGLRVGETGDRRRARPGAPGGLSGPPADAPPREPPTARLYGAPSSGAVGRFPGARVGKFVGVSRRQEQASRAPEARSPGDESGHERHEDRADGGHDQAARDSAAEGDAEDPGERTTGGAPLSPDSPAASPRARRAVPSRRAAPRGPYRCREARARRRPSADPTRPRT